MFDFMLWTGLAVLAVALIAFIASLIVRGRDGKPRRDLQVGALWMAVCAICILGLYVLEIAGIDG